VSKPTQWQAVGCEVFSCGSPGRFYFPPFFGIVVVVVGATVVVVVGATVVVVVGATVVVVVGATVVVVVGATVVVVVVVGATEVVVVVVGATEVVVVVVGATVVVVVPSLFPPPSQPGVSASSPLPPPQFLFSLTTLTVVFPEPC
jgi:hypothetical protein